MSETIIHTIGYEGRDLPSFVSILQQAQVNLLVDIRRRAGNGRKPDYAKQRLSAALAAANIAYRHLPDLAPSHELRAKLRDKEVDRAEYLTRFQAELADRQQHVDGLLEVARQHRCCLMCMEAEPSCCHRSVLAELLKVHGNVQIANL